MGVVKPKNSKVRTVENHGPSPADETDARALDQAVEWMIKGKLSDWDNTRPIKSLNRADLRQLATNAITGFVLERAKCQYDPISDALSAEPTLDQNLGSDPIQTCTQPAVATHEKSKT